MFSLAAQIEVGFSNGGRAWTSFEFPNSAAKGLLCVYCKGGSKDFCSKLAPASVFVFVENVYVLAFLGY